MTISEQITAGIKEALNGKVSADLQAMTTERDTEKSRADKAASDLVAMTAERDREKARADKAEADLAAARTAKVEVDQKAVDDAASKKAASIAASAGQPPVPKSETAATPADAGDLLAQRAALKTSAERAAFDTKHKQALFNLARAGIRKELAAQS